jgi:hypothetical protein
MELWEVFGSRSEYLKAPRSLSLKVSLALQKKHELEQEETKKDAEERERLQEQIDALNAQRRG